MKQLDHRPQGFVVLGLLLVELLVSTQAAPEVHRQHTHFKLRISQAAEAVSSALFGASQEDPLTRKLLLPTYVLTLPNAAVRRAKMVERLQEAQTDFTFVDGINASQQFHGDKRARQLTGIWAVPDARDLDFLDYEWVLNLTVPGFCRSTSLPHLACSLSHVLTALAAYEAGHEMVLVLEDDMQVLRWPDQGLIRSAPPGWEVLQLYMLGKAAQSLYMDPPALWVPWRPGIFNTGAYIVNRAGMRKMIRTYLPEAEEGPGGFLTELNVSTIHNSECVADYMVYNPTQAYVSTDFHFVEEALDSGIKPEQLGLHQQTKKLVLQLLEERGFQNVRQHA